MDEAIKAKSTALNFAVKLMEAEMDVRPNLTNTGRLNGFSFGLGGLIFTGQALRDGYKWSSLQTRGVTYEPAKDRKKLERFKLPLEIRGQMPMELPINKQQLSEKPKVPANNSQNSSHWNRTNKL